MYSSVSVNVIFSRRIQNEYISLSFKKTSGLFPGRVKKWPRQKHRFGNRSVWGLFGSAGLHWAVTVSVPSEPGPRDSFQHIAVIDSVAVTACNNFHYEPRAASPQHISISRTLKVDSSYCGGARVGGSEVNLLTPRRLLWLPPCTNSLISVSTYHVSSDT